MTFTETGSALQAQADNASSPVVLDRDYAAAKAWFSDRVVEARKTGIVFTIACLTPALAQVLIDHHMPHRSNRRLRLMKIKALTRAIMGGAWDRNTHQGIAFATDGTVNDGQHRIHAVRAAGIAVELLMAFGQPRSTFEVIDQDITPRTAADLLDLAQLNVNTATHAAAICRFVLAIRRLYAGGVMQHAMNEISKADILAFAREHAKQVRVAVSDGAKIANGIKAKVSPSNSGAALYLIREMSKDTTAINEFVAGLASGAGLLKNSPLLVCREGLRSAAFGSQIRTGSDRRSYEAGAIVMAWNKWRAGEKVRSVSALQIEQPRLFPKVRA